MNPGKMKVKFGYDAELPDLLGEPMLMVYSPCAGVETIKKLQKEYHARILWLEFQPPGRLQKYNGFIAELMDCFDVVCLVTDNAMDTRFFGALRPKIRWVLDMDANPRYIRFNIGRHVEIVDMERSRFKAVKKLYELDRWVL